MREEDESNIRGGETDMDLYAPVDMKQYGETIGDRLSYQYREVGEIEDTAQTIDFSTHRTVTCLGTQPSRLDERDHIKCGQKVSIKHAFKCLYCNFWFCQKMCRNSFR